MPSMPVRTGLRYDVDRPVPQVEAVGDHPDPAQRGARAPFRVGSARATWSRRQQPRPGDAARTKPPSYKNEDVSEVCVHIQPRATAETSAVVCSTRDRQRSGRAAASRRASRAARHQQRRSAGVGPVVHAGRVRRVVEDCHQRCRRNRDDPGDDCERAPSRSPAQHAEDDQRPDQIELLFDRERPHVPQRRRCAELIEVRLVREDEPPVGDVEERGQPVGPDAATRAPPRGAAPCPCRPPGPIR